MNDNDFSLSKNILNELIDSNDDINNTNKFLNCSSKILNYIIEYNQICQNISDKEINYENKNNFNIINLISSKKQRNDVVKSNYTENKIIEKYIDFRDTNNLNKGNKNSTLSLYSYCNKSPKNNDNAKNIQKNRENNSESLKTSQSSYNIWKTPKSHFQKNIYLRKSVTPIISQSFCNKFNFANENIKDGSMNLISNSSKTIEGNIYLNKSSSMKNNIHLNKSLKFLELSTLKKSTSNTKEKKFDISNKINLNKGILNLKQNHFKGKEKEQKTYIHKKLINSNNISNNLKKNLEKLNLKRHIRANSNLVSRSSNKLLDFGNITASNAFYLNNIDKNILNNISKNDRIKSSIFKMLDKQKEKSLQKNNQEKNNIKIKSNPKIIKTNYDDKILIDSSFPLYLGLDLGDNDCKLSIVNGKHNEIKLISFKKDIYNIPSIIYFDKNNEGIKIGHEAEFLGIKEHSQIIFNLLKYIGINYDDIIEKKELLPFKIYRSDNNQRPYVKIDFNGIKDKLFYFEDVLSLFLQKLFEILFGKIIIENENDTTLNIFLELSLPNYLTYLQKKVIEKIFHNQVFPQNIDYNNYNINLLQINLENSSNIAYLYDLITKENDSKEKNILIMFTDKCSINLSIVNFNRILYEVKAVESVAFGEEELINNYLCYCLRNVEIREHIDLIKYPSVLYKLKRNISLAIKNFDIIPKTQINLEINDSSGMKDKNISIILNKEDYEKSCEEIFNKIKMLIKNIIDKAKLLAIDLEDIILIGQTSKSSKMKKILLDIFKENQKINYKLASTSYQRDIDSEYLIAIGCAIQSMNNNNLLKQKYFYIDICPSSFGVESINGKMEIIIPKGRNLPCKNKKLIKINNKNENICINLFEGEDANVKNNKFIISANIDKSNLRKNGQKDFIEIYIQLEIDIYNNLKCFIHEPTSKNRYECLININVVKK